MQSTGKFITFEGAEGVSKSTQAKLLFEYFKNSGMFPIVHHMSFPTCDTSIGEFIRSGILSGEKTLSSECIYHLFVANRWEKQKEIDLILKAGGIIICDRYVDSGISYGISNGLDMQWCLKMEEGLTIPTHVIHLQIPNQHLEQMFTERVLQRDNNNNNDNSHNVVEIYDTLEWQRKIQTSFAKLHDQRLVEGYDAKWTTLDIYPNMSIDQVHELVLKCIMI